MGMFLAMTCVVGRSKDQVVNSLRNYTQSVGGGLEKADISLDDDHCCIIQEQNGNTSVYNADGHLAWDDSSRFISAELNAPVFSFHIHDGDLWMYIMFVNGEPVDQFNPVPDYWEEHISEEEIESWKGSAETISQHVKYIKKQDIENYLVRWDLDAEEGVKAYPNDEFGQEDWQLLDFMKKLGFPYPIDDDWKPIGDTYRFWTNELPLKTESAKVPNGKLKAGTTDLKKPWWKFWE